MIVYVATERFLSPAIGFVKYNAKALGGMLVPLSYEELFFERSGPVGHYIFTDFDRLSRYELECAAAFAGALTKAAPSARILNHPLRVLERYALLRALHKEGINAFTATRLESGVRPQQYPVFIRAEDGYGGPETDLLHNDAEFDAAVEDLFERGKPRRGRIAIGYAGERAPDGYFHKYGAFHIAGRIVPHDLMYGRSWVVKIRFANTGWAQHRDEDYAASEEAVAQELRYIKGNPHQGILRRVFNLAGIDYGRADYGVVDGRVQIYEINTNPHLPFEDSRRRPVRGALVRGELLDAFKAVDTQIEQTRLVRFQEPRPRAHNLHWPRQRLAISLLRRIANWAGCR